MMNLDVHSLPTRLITVVLAVACVWATTSLKPAPAVAAVPRAPACAFAAADGIDRPVSAGAADPAPNVTARTAVVIDGDSGLVLFDRGGHIRRPPASTTKIMTAILTIENGDFDRVVMSDVDASRMPESSVMGLRPGIPVSERDLIFGLMLPSGNDAAIELAEAIDGNVPAFVERMNAKANELGLRDTHFANPHGLDARTHYSSAYDLAMLARYAMENPTFAGLVSTQNWQLSPPLDYTLQNGNSLLEQYPGADGVKIGWTDRAGWTFVASATREGHRLIVSLMDSDDRDADARALLDWGWAASRRANVSALRQAMLAIASRFGFRSPIFDALCP